MASKDIARSSSRSVSGQFLPLFSDQKQGGLPTLRRPKPKGKMQNDETKGIIDPLQTLIRAFAKDERKPMSVSASGSS
jgi:hypothetical protein